MPPHTDTPALTSGATMEGTDRYRSRFAARRPADFYRPLPSGGVVSSVGLGTYLGDCSDDDDAQYRAAARACLDHGINLFDTAINYRCQRSERALGAALREAFGAGTSSRDEVAVCTKGGYIPLDGAPPPTRDAYHAYLEREYYLRGVMTPNDVVADGHCITPSFLADQLARSRSNLGVDVIDVYYVHNPEQQLDSVARPRLRELLRDAFAMLEQRTLAGEIAVYGCATWDGFRVGPKHRAHLELAELVTLAREVGGDDHHFRVVQLPINLALTEAVRAPTQRLGRRTVSLLEAAAELGVSVVASATLMQAQLARGLPQALRAAFPDQHTDAQRAIAFTRGLPAVTAALVGMRGADHVMENLGDA